MILVAIFTNFSNEFVFLSNYYFCFSISQVFLLEVSQSQKVKSDYIKNSFNEC